MAEPLGTPATPAAGAFPAADMTYLSFSDQHGVQIEYLATDGRAYLWYPGNRKVVSGEWTVVLDRICYRYGPDTYNPVTRQTGGEWNCSFASFLARHTKDAVRGDPFGLAARGGAVPFVSGRCTVPDGFELKRIPECTS